MSTALVDQLRFLALDDRKLARRAIKKARVDQSGDCLGRILLVEAGLHSSLGRHRNARKISDRATCLISSELGRAEQLGLMISLDQDSGKAAQALALARAAAGADYKDLEAQRFVNYYAGLAEYNAGNATRASMHFAEASKTDRSIFRVGALANLTRLATERHDFESATAFIARASKYTLPNRLHAHLLHTQGRLAFAQGRTCDAIRFEEDALSALESTEPLRIARHTLVLLEYLAEDRQFAKAERIAYSARVLVFDLEEERQEIAAAAMLELCRAAAASQVSRTLVYSAQRELAKEPNRWGRTFQGRA